MRTNAPWQHRPDDEYPLWMESAPPRLSMLERIARRKGEVFLALWLSAAAVYLLSEPIAYFLAYFTR